MYNMCMTILRCINDYVTTIHNAKYTISAMGHRGYSSVNETRSKGDNHICLSI